MQRAGCPLLCLVATVEEWRPSEIQVVSLYPRTLLVPRPQKTAGAIHTTPKQKGRKRKGEQSVMRSVKRGRENPRKSTRRHLSGGIPWRQTRQRIRTACCSRPAVSISPRPTQNVNNQPGSRRRIASSTNGAVSAMNSSAFIPWKRSRILHVVHFDPEW